MQPTFTLAEVFGAEAIYNPRLSYRNYGWLPAEIDLCDALTGGALTIAGTMPSDLFACRRNRRRKGVAGGSRFPGVATRHHLRHGIRIRAAAGRCRAERQTAGFSTCPRAAGTAAFTVLVATRAAVGFEQQGQAARLGAGRTPAGPAAGCAGRFAAVGGTDLPGAAGVESGQSALQQRGPGGGHRAPAGRRAGGGSTAGFVRPGRDRTVSGGQKKLLPELRDGFRGDSVSGRHGTGDG